MILTAINHKGGVGKTTVSLNLAATAANEGYNTCLIDLDPKGDLTKVFLDLKESDLTTYDLINYSVPLPECAIETYVDNLFIIPANNQLNNVLGHPANSKILFSLKEKIKPYYRNTHIKSRQDNFCFTKLTNDFDIIIIDTPPVLNLLTTISLIAATHIIIPVLPSYFCIQGIIDLITFYNMTKEKYNPSLSMIGYIMNNVDYESDSDKEVEEIFRLNWHNVFTSVIQRNTIIENALISGQSIITYCNENPLATESAGEFIRVFRELEERSDGCTYKYNMGNR